MALPKQFFSFFLLLLLSSTLHVHARDSQFFSKVTKKTEEVVQVPPKTDSQKTEQQEPNFIPDTQNGYGLFGHESGQLPPSTTTTTNPSGEPFANTNSNTFNNKEAYVTNSQGMSDNTKFMDRGYTNPNEESATTAATATTTAAADFPYGEESGESNVKNYYNNDAYVTGSQGNNVDSKFMDRGYPTTTTTTSSPYAATTTANEPFANSNPKNYYNNNAYVTGSQGMDADSKFMDRGYPTTTTTTSSPYATATANEASANSNPENYYNNNAYVTGQQGMSDTRFMDRGYTTPTTTTTTSAATNTDNNYYYYNNDGTVIDPEGYSTTATATSAVNNDEFVGADPQAMRGRTHTTTSTNNQFSGPTKFLDAGYTTTTTPATSPYRGGAATNNYYSNNQRQGMSDTRFMENGRYYYDSNTENNHNYANGYANSRGNEYNTQGYYGNNEKNSFDQYRNSNSMEGYQNQEFQEEDPQEFEP